MFRHSARVSTALALLAFAAVGCSSDGTSPSGSCTPGGSTVCAVNTSFSPSTLTIAVGTTVTFHNSDGFTHTTSSSSVPAGGPTWDRNLSPGGETTVTFSTAGTYQYYCKIHGTPTAGMHATIVVQ